MATCSTFALLGHEVCNSSKDSPLVSDNNLNTVIKDKRQNKAKNQKV